MAALPEQERTSPRAVLHTVAAVVWTQVVDQPDACRVLMEARTLAAYHRAIADAVQAADRRTHEQLESLVQAGEWPPHTDAALQARLFTAGLYGLMAHWHLSPGSFSWEAAARSLADGSPAQP
ncbi:MAG: hypothetical protein HOY79_54565 [Streptomyces sp.]|nr:hypothetical protein [Streptomyces sp.]